MAPITSAIAHLVEVSARRLAIGQVIEAQRKELLSLLGG
jgi:hypothetical protein